MPRGGVSIAIFYLCIAQRAASGSPIHSLGLSDRILMASQLHNEGKILREKRLVQPAVARFLLAYELNHDPMQICEIAQTFDDNKEASNAIVYYKNCLAQLPMSSYYKSINQRIDAIKQNRVKHEYKIASISMLITGVLSATASFALLGISISRRNDIQKLSDEWEKRSIRDEYYQYLGGAVGTLSLSITLTGSGIALFQKAKRKQ